MNFNDPRCGDGRGLCPTDPLLFTCIVTGGTATSITVKIDDVLEIDFNVDNTIDGDLPDGFTVPSHNVQTNVGSLDYTLVLSIVNASLLNGSLIVCESNTFGVDDSTAECPVVGKLNIYIVLVCVLKHWWSCTMSTHHVVMPLFFGQQGLLKLFKCVT